MSAFLFFAHINDHFKTFNVFCGLFILNFSSFWHSLETNSHSFTQYVDSLCSLLLLYILYTLFVRFILKNMKYARFQRYFYLFYHVYNILYTLIMPKYAVISNYYRPTMTLKNVEKDYLVLFSTKSMISKNF